MEHIIHGLTFLTQQPDADSVQCGRGHSVWQVSVDVHDAMSAEQDRRQNENSERLPKRDLLEAEDVWDRHWKMKVKIRSATIATTNPMSMLATGSIADLPWRLG